MDQTDGRCVRVISGDYVTTEDGTGIVHIAPTFGADDDRVAKQQNIAPLVVVDKAGKRQPMVDRTGKFFLMADMDPAFVASNVDAEAYREYEGRFVKNAYDPKLTGCRRDARRLDLHDAESGRQGVQNREAYPQLSALLAYRQAGALLSARLVVHQDDSRERAPDRTQRNDQLETGFDR